MTRISPRVRVVLPAPESPTTPSTIGRTIGAAYLVLGLCARGRWRRLSGASVVRAGLAAEWRSAIGRGRWRRSRYPGSGWVAGSGVRGWFRIPLRSPGSPGEHLWLYGPVLGSELVGGGVVGGGVRCVGGVCWLYGPVLGSELVGGGVVGGGARCLGGVCWLYGPVLGSELVGLPKRVKWLGDGRWRSESS